MKVIGLIPARGGSKTIPRKNIRIIAGKPLLAWTAEAALNSALDRVILSSDDQEIINVGLNLGLEIPFVRPLELGRDDTPGIQVILHALNYLIEDEDYNADAIMLLQPTSPLRTSKHINEAIELFGKYPEVNSLVSVVKAPHNMIPESLMRMDSDGHLVFVSHWDQKKNIRQLKPVYYARNGPAIFLGNIDYILKHGRMYGEKVVAYEMNRSESVDIDDSFDFDLCEFLLMNKEKNDGNKFLLEDIK